MEPHQGALDHYSARHQRKHNGDDVLDQRAFGRDILDTQFPRPKFRLGLRTGWSSKPYRYFRRLDASGEISRGDHKSSLTAPCGAVVGLPSVNEGPAGRESERHPKTWFRVPGCRRTFLCHCLLDVFCRCIFGNSHCYLSFPVSLYSFS